MRESDGGEMGEVDKKPSGMIIIISGPSGVGKGTICGRLLEEDMGLAISASATTRDQNQSEIDGENYFFFSDEAFQELVDHDAFLEWAEVHGRRYGTLQSKVREILESGRDCLLEIDVQGGLQVSQKIPKSCVTIFIKAPSEEELIKRITGRGRGHDDIKRRMMTARWEMTQEEVYQYSVVNDSLDEAVDEVLRIIREERISHASAID